jgi:hypothetical protein
MGAALQAKTTGSRWQYICWGVLLWAIVDFGTAGGFRIAYYEKYGPALLLFYAGFPLVFAYLVYSLRWNGKKLLVATLLEIGVVEIFFTRNPLLMQFPVFLLGIPLAVFIYLPLTFFPLWIVQKEMRRHAWVAVGLSACELAVMALTVFGSASRV